MPRFLELIAGLPNRGVRARVDFAGLLTFPGIEEYYMPLDDIPEDILIQTYETALAHGLNLRLSHASASLRPISKCTAWTEPYILIGGEVISCCAIIMSNNRHHLRQNSFGNVYETPFLQIWNSSRYRNFRKLVNRNRAPVPQNCLNCRAFEASQRAGTYGVAEGSH
jgi:radical SAM protein with 4Fe4S-binding SPASM domain